MRKTMLALAGLIGLTACAEGLDLAGLGRDGTGEGTRTLALLDGAVRVRGPRRYCVDQSASAAARGFAIMAGCAVLSDSATVMPDRAGLLTVQFGASGSALVGTGADDLAEVLGSDAGQALMASGDAGAEIAEVEVRDTRVAVRFEDRAGPPLPGTTPAIWRGFADVGDRLVTVSVLSYTRDPLTHEAGRILLDRTLDAIESVNRPAPGTP